MDNQKPYGSVLLKAIRILDFLAEVPNSSLKKIAIGTEMTSPTALKILDTLASAGYVSRDKEKNYRIGAQLIKYANQNIQQNDLVSTTLPFLERLQNNIDETIHLGILSNDEILYINKLEPKSQTIRMSSKVGVANPLYCSAMGKAVLANFRAEEWEKYLQETPLKAYTEHTITNQLKLEKAIAEVKKSGIAYDNEEIEKEIFCIGAALKKGEDILGAFSISMPKYRINEKEKQKISRAVLQTKSEIENIL